MTILKASQQLKNEFLLLFLSVLKYFLLSVFLNFPMLDELMKETLFKANYTFPN